MRFDRAKSLFKAHFPVRRHYPPLKKAFSGNVFTEIRPEKSTGRTFLAVKYKVSF